MKKKAPTPAQIKAARALRKRARAMLKKAYKVLDKIHPRGRPMRRKINPKEIEFRTWEHDLSILMPALARSPEAMTWSPKELAARAAGAADQMKTEVGLR